MNILVYKGEFAYDVVNLFMFNTVHFLKKRGHNIILIDTFEPNAGTKLVEAFNTQTIDFVISFGMANNPILGDGTSLYNVTNATILAIYVDHPAYHISSLTENIKNFLCCFNDRHHVDYVNEILPNHHKIAFFLPHGGLTKTMEEDNRIKNFKTYTKEKSIDILFSGTYMEKEPIFWENNENYPSTLIYETFELFMKDDYLSIQGAFEIIFDKYKIKFSTIGKVQLSNLYKIFQNYVRSYSRVLVIKELAEKGLNITICGAGWDDFVEDYENINYIGSLDIRENLELIKKAKVLVNITPTLRNGSHERVFTGMLNNTVVFTDRSAYYDEYFENNKNILYYSFNSLDEDVTKLKELLSNDKELFEMSQNAYDIATKYHTWENRVDTMLEMVKLSKLMDK